MPRKLQDLPEHLRRWYTTPAEELPAEDNKCFTCWREYNTVEHELNPNKQPFQALRMQLCNHIIGSRCLPQLLKREMLNCRYCNTEIATSTTVPSWIVWLLEHDRCAISPAVWLDLARDIVDANPPGRVLKHFDRLKTRLFVGTLGLYDGLWLWRHYMVYPVYETILAMVCFSIANVISYFIVGPFLNLATAALHIPQLSLCVSGVDVIEALPRLHVLVCLVIGSHLCARHVQCGGIASILALLVLALGARNSTELFSFKIMFALMTCNLVLYGVMVGWLVWLGMRNHKL